MFDRNRKRRLRRFAGRPNAAERSVAQSDAVKRIDELTRTARANWLGLLAYLAFVGVTLLGVEDIDFFLPERQTELPLVGITVPTALFFYIAPFLGAMLYIHLHLYLLKLWKSLAEAPERIGGEPLGERISPWVISDMALGLRAGARHQYRLRGLASLVGVISIFLAGPIVLAFFWWRSMPKHDELLTIVFCGLPLFATIFVGWTSWQGLRRGAAQGPRKSGWAKVGWGMVALAVSVFGWFATEGSLEKYAKVNRIGSFAFKSFFDRRLEHERQSLREEIADLDAAEFLQRFGFFAAESSLNSLAEKEIRARWWVRMLIPALFKPADLSDSAFVGVRDDWQPRHEAFAGFRRQRCSMEGLKPSICGEFREWLEDSETAPSAHVQAARTAWCDTQREAGLVQSEERCAAYFERLEANIRRDWKTERSASLRAMERDFSRSDFRQSSLDRSQMSGLDLSWSRADGASFVSARLEQANLMVARLAHADLVLARLQNANLRWADIAHADFSRAQMQGAVLENASAQGARFEGASLAEADLTRITVDRRTSFQDTDFSGAMLRFVDLSLVDITLDQIASAFGDASVKLPAGMSAPEHWPDWILPSSRRPIPVEIQFRTQYQRWLADPQGYTPPPNPRN
jgi:uncharacterized protein YjbI with pentapeptide repeats